MTKGYLIAVPLQTMRRAENSIIHRHIQPGNCGEIAAKFAGLPATCSPNAHDEFSGVAGDYRLDRAP
jgi:hypothetical protein